MFTTRQLRLILEYKYGLIADPKTLREINRKNSKIFNSKIKITGRSCRTGKKKTVKAKFIDLNW